MGKPTKRIYEFGTFRLDTAERLLLCNGETVPLTPKAFDTLVVLVQKSGHVVGKDELMNEVWADSFVEESNLTQNIFVLRKLLGEDYGGRSYIETVPKRGYRFVASVREVLDDDTGDLATEKDTDRRIISKAIAKDDMLNSLAVLPLTNVSDNPDAEYLSDGITESIINSLSKLPQLRVMARSTVFRYKGKEVDPQQVGQVLGVRAVLVGRVLQQSASLIVRTELVDVANGWQLWGEQYNRKLADILALQEEIAQEISEKLRIKLTGEDKKRLAKRYTDDSEAYRLYLKGRYYWNKYTKEGLTKAIEYFNQSIELDPSYALAYTGLADSYYRLTNAYSPPKEALPKARTAAMKALEIDDTLAEAHASLGLIKLYYDWDWAGAEHHYKRAIELDPRCVLAHQRYGSYLAVMGRFDESIAILKRGQELDPLSLLISSLLGISLYLSRQYDKSVEQYPRTVDMDANYLQARLGLGLAYTQKGMYQEAIPEFQKARNLAEDLAEAVAELGYVYAVSGKISDAEEVLDELRERSERDYISPYNIAKIYVGLGEKDLTFEWLERAYEERSEWLTWLKVDPKLDSVRSDPRFRDLMQRVGFEPQ
ncbi:MAG: winged helix-turn-helix domain-containing protein [Acidobacteriota bacterium]